MKANPSNTPCALARLQPEIGSHAGDRADALDQIGVGIRQNTRQGRNSQPGAEATREARELLKDFLARTLKK